MSLLALTATRLTPGGLSPTNLTAALTALGSNTGVTFPNTGREILLVSSGSSPTTPTSKIGTTVQGQAVASEVASALATTAWSSLGPYPSQFDAQDGTQTVEIDFSSSTNISVLLIQIPGVI